MTEAIETFEEIEGNENVEEIDYTDTIALLEGRCHQYCFLARLFRKEVKIADIEELQGMRFPMHTGNGLVDEGFRDLYDYLRGAWEDSERELAIDYVRTFIGHGVNGYSAAYPYESVYTSERRLMMQEARSEVLATLRANNLKRGKWNEGEDHIAIELEFMQIMSQRAIDSIKAGELDAAEEQLKTSLTFLKDHLLNWFPMMEVDMEKFSRTEFYRGLGKLTLGYLEVDRDSLEDLLSDE